MSISGHKNMDSMAIYQKVNSNEKLHIGMTLGYILLQKPNNTEIISPAQIPIANVPVKVQPQPQVAIEYPTPA